LYELAPLASGRSIPLPLFGLGYRVMDAARQPLQPPIGNDAATAERGCIRKLLPCFRKSTPTEEASLPNPQNGGATRRGELRQSCADRSTVADEAVNEARPKQLVQELGATLRRLRQLPQLPHGSDEACQRVEEDLKILEAVIAGEAPDSSVASPKSDEYMAKTPKDKLRKVVVGLKDQRSVVMQPGSLSNALNDMIRILWPRIDIFVEDLIKTSIEPSINASLPGMLQGGVKFQKVSLGNASPLLGPITVQHDKDSGAIEMHVGIDFTSELDVQLIVMGIPVGITSFLLKGDLVLLFTPPMTKPPFFGGVQVYFANPPDISLNFIGAAKVANVPGLRGAVRGAIDNAVAGVCVLPRRIAVDMNDEDDIDIIDLTYPEPLGVLRFTLFSGEALVASDTSIFGTASSDPYVVASLGLKTWTSPHISKSLNPVWGDSSGLTVDFPVHDDDQSLILKVYDYDFGLADDLIGMTLNTQTRVKDLVASGVGKMEVKLMKADESPGGGSLTISATFLSLANIQPSKPLSAGGPSEAHLSAKILTVTGLNENSEYPFKVLVRVAHSTDDAPKNAASAKTTSSKSGPTSTPKASILAEGATAASHPKERKQLAEALQGIAKNLSQRQKLDAKDIAEILDVGPRQVEQFLTSFGEGQSKEQQQAEQEYVNVHHPMFDEVVQLLLPCGSVDELAIIELAVVDKRDQVLATARVSMPQVWEAPQLRLEGPFETDVEGIEVVGSLCLRWLA